MMRTAAEFGQALRAVFVVALQPLVDGLACDAIAICQLCDRHPRLMVLDHQESLFFHSDLLPGHAFYTGPPRLASELLPDCHRCPQNVLLPMSSERTFCERSLIVTP